MVPYDISTSIGVPVMDGIVGKFDLQGYYESGSLPISQGDWVELLLVTARRASDMDPEELCSTWSGMLTVCEHWLQEHKPQHASPAYLSAEQQGPLNEILYDEDARNQRDPYHYDKGKGSKGKTDEAQPKKGSGKRRRTGQ